jgi:heptosyltransferase-2
MKDLQKKAKGALVKKILVRAPNWIGDQILAFPFFYFLRKAYPQAHITVACVPWVEAVQFKDLVNQVFILPRPESTSLWDRWNAMESAAKSLRAFGPWDLGICLPNSFSSAWIQFRSGVKKRRGYSMDGRGFLLNEACVWDREMVSHRSDAYLKLLPQDVQHKVSALDFWGEYPDNELDPKIPGELESFDAKKAWSNNSSRDSGPLDPPKTKYWILAPGSTAESRRWPSERFVALARLIADETGWKGVIIGGPSESSLAQQMISDPSLKLEDWTGKGSVSSYWKVFQKAQFTVSNDSGLGHVAALCGSPVQVVWGAGNPKRTEPIGPGKVKISLNPVDCWPCESNICSQIAGKKLDCLKGITPETVWEEIKTGIRIHL